MEDAYRGITNWSAGRLFKVQRFRLQTARVGVMIAGTPLHATWGDMCTGQSTQVGRGVGVHTGKRHSRKVRAEGDRLARKPVHAVPSPYKVHAVPRRRVPFAKDSSTCSKPLIYWDSALIYLKDMCWV